MTSFLRPGLWTDTNNPSKPLAPLKDLGFEWILFQLQNDARIIDRRDGIAMARNIGLVPGAWGVSYGNFAADAGRLRDQVRQQGAELVNFNVERPIPEADALSIIGVFADFPGPKSIVTLTGYLDHIQAPIFLAHGWDILTESYVNEQANLTPEVGEYYAQMAGIPKDRFGHLLGMYPGANGLPTGESYANMLISAGAQNRFSCWMVEHEQSDMDDYRALAQAITPVIPPEVIVAIQKLALNNTGINAVADRLEQVFDAAGIVEPDGIDALRKHLVAVGEKTNELVDAVNALVS